MSYSFSMAVVTNYKLVWNKINLLSHISCTVPMLEVSNQMSEPGSLFKVSRIASISCLSLSFCCFWQLSVDTSFPSCLHCTLAFSPCVHIVFPLCLCAPVFLSPFSSPIKITILWIKGPVWPVWACLVAQTVKNLPTMQKIQVESLAEEDSLEKGMTSIWQAWPHLN